MRQNLFAHLRQALVDRAISRSEFLQQRFSIQQRYSIQQRFRRDENGATAIEFAMVGLPFFMMLFGIITVGFYFFAIFSLENAVEQASRPIRTGEAQQAGMTKEQFKDKVCENAPKFFDCTQNMRVNVAKTPLNEAPTIPGCTDAGGALLPPASTTYTPGVANENTVVTVCYEWDLPGKMPWLRLGNMSNGNAMLQATTAFKTEPYQ